MSRTVLALVLVAATATTASAGAYVGLGIGTGPATSGAVPVEPDGRSGRLMLGFGFGRLAIEGLGSRYDMVRSDGHEYTGTTLALAGRINFPIGDNFELFGRVGVQHTSLDPKLYMEPYSGTGFLVAPGVDYRIPLGLTSLAVFIDYTIQHAAMGTQYGTGTLGMTSRVWTLGATLSF